MKKQRKLVCFLLQLVILVGSSKYLHALWDIPLDEQSDENQQVQLRSSKTRINTGRNN